MSRKYIQGYFKPKFPEKYVGDVNNIFFRSSWELKFLNWCDNNPSVLRYANEELVIPYVSPVDGKPHRYFVDFVIMVKTRKDEIKKYAVEIKPHAQTEPPKQKRKTKKYLQEMMTYAVNTAKWESADAFCKRNSMEFLVLTERHLF
jgi:hypothetical protein